MSTTRTAARLAALPAAALLTLAVAGPAAAHVTIAPSTTEAGAYAVLTVSVPHGCEDQPTNRVTIDVPEQITSVTPTRNAYWEVETVTEQLDEPITDADGNQITERVAQVVYTTDEPLPSPVRDTFELSLQLPDAPGETLAFPTVQDCPGGAQSTWTEVAADGQSEDDLETPAPTVTITEPVEGEAGATDASADAGGTDETVSAAAADGGESGPSGVAVAGLVAGLLGLAAGLAALVVARRRA